MRFNGLPTRTARSSRMYLKEATQKFWNDRARMGGQGHLNIASRVAGGNGPKHMKQTTKGLPLS